MRRLIWLILALLLISLACNLPGATARPVEPPLTENVVATLVSEKLTQSAAAEIEPAPATPEPPAPDIETFLRVVYAKDNAIYVWDEKLGSRQITKAGNDSHPKLSSDGNVIAFMRASELWTIRSDGTGEQMLIGASYLSSFAASPDGATRILTYQFLRGTHTLYFDTWIETEAIPFPQYDLHSVSADGGAPGPLLKPGLGGSIRFSPDGQWMSIAGSQSISVARINGAEYRQVFSFPLVSMYSESFYLPEIIWKKESDGFYTIIPASKALEDPNEKSRYWFIPLRGEPARLAEFPSVPPFAAAPILSPDGLKVLYLKPAGDNVELHVIDVSTADSLYTYYAANKLGLGGWAPDSMRFYYWIEDPRAHWIAALGQPASMLTDTTISDDVVWVSENQILFLRENELRRTEIGSASIGIDFLGDDRSFDFAMIQR
jgi:dipeptidyl aminopeptidase/acylaminoacyl peptidase